MKQIFQIQLTLFFCLVSSALMADTRWYQVEVIVFEQNMPNSEVFEQAYSEISFPANPAYLTKAKYPLPGLLENPVAYARVASDGMLLHGTYNRLNRNNNYDPLLHVSWIQPANANQVNRAVYLGLTDGYGENILSGTVKIQRGHYLHLITDMEYAPGKISASGEGDFFDPSIYRIREKRRLKLNEVHYLDHPMFGIIFTVKPI